MNRLRWRGFREAVRAAWLGLLEAGVVSLKMDKLSELTRLRLDETAFADSCAARGSVSGLVGKGHTGAGETHHPLGRGYREFEGVFGVDQLPNGRYGLDAPGVKTAVTGERHTLAHFVDFFPALADLSGLALPPRPKPRDGALKRMRPFETRAERKGDSHAAPGGLVSAPRKCAPFDRRRPELRWCLA